MIRSLIALALLGSTVPAAAADRTIGVGSFDRVRIDGAFDVRIVTGTSPRAAISGDAKALALVDLRVEGTTLYLRRQRDQGTTATTATTATTPVIVMLSAQALTSATMQGGGTLTVTGMRGARADLSVAGTGTIAVTGVDVEQANASVIGSGAITWAGRAAHVRLSVNGPGSIDAGALVADDLVVRIDGPGEAKADARYLAAVYSSGLGRVTVTGKAKCTVRAPAGGAVSCGK